MTESLIASAAAEEGRLPKSSSSIFPGSEKWGYVITMPYIKLDRQNSIARGSVVRRLRLAGLDIRKSLSRDEDELFILIQASDELIRLNAERMRLELPLKEEFGGGYFVYTQAKAETFEDGIFTTAMKQHVIRFIIQARTGANITISKWKASGKINQCFPLHVKEEVEALDETMLRTYHPLKIPLQMIRSYFGEKFALYFAFLQHYIVWLIGPALVGLAVFIYQVSADRDDGFHVISLFSIFITIWSTLFSKYWVRKNCVLAKGWNMRDFVNEEQELPTFEGNLEVGFNTSLGFIELDAQKYPNHLAKHYPEEARLKKYVMSAPLFTAIIGIVITGTISILFFRNINTYFTIFSGVINGVFIVIFNQIYNNLAIWLTNWENHRTETAWENALIIKKFCFQFVNSYISLYYIAFWKSHVQREDPDSTNACLKNNCIYELGYQLAFIFLLQIFWGQFQEIGIPYLVSKFKIRMEDEAVRESQGTAKPMSDIEYQSKLTPFEGLLDDYNEMMIQFGYVTLFSLAFPLAPAAALFNNIFEVRVDGLKYLRGTQRPHYQGAANIGYWQTIMDFMSLGSVVTNCAVIYWTINLWSGETIVFIEHATLLLKLTLVYFIPDTPLPIAKQILREEYEHRATLHPERSVDWDKEHPHADDDPDSDHFEEMD